jgi:beta-lactamase regulating signal transducer with metallopeptidase domain
MSLLILCLLIFVLIAPKKFTPQMRYAAWVVIFVGLAIPLRPMLGDGLVTIGIPQTNTFTEQIPTVEQPTTQQITEEIVQSRDDGASVQNTSEFATSTQTTPSTFSFLSFAAVMWIVVAVGIFTYHMMRYFGYIRAARRWSVAVEDKAAFSLFQKVQEEKGIKGNKIGLMRCGFVTTSMLIGFFRPVVLLPDKDFDADELEFIFGHELIHYKRKDLYIKFLSMFATSLHWFNPLVYLMSNAMQTDCEASCDEAVLLESNIDDRQFYAELIIEMVSNTRRKGPFLSTCFYGTKRGIRMRMETIMNGASRIRRGSLAIMVVGILVLTFLSGSVFGIALPVAYASEVTAPDVEASEMPITDGSISASQARDIAFNAVGGGEFIGLFYDSNLNIFRIEILNNNIRYYLAIDSTTGNAMIYHTQETYDSDDTEDSTDVPVTPVEQDYPANGDEQHTNTDQQQAAVSEYPTHLPTQAAIPSTPVAGAIDREEAIELARAHLNTIGRENAAFVYAYEDIDDGRPVWSIEFAGGLEFYVCRNTGTFFKSPMADNVLQIQSEEVSPNGTSPEGNVSPPDNWPSSSPEGWSTPSHANPRWTETDGSEWSWGT